MECRDENFRFTCEARFLLTHRPRRASGNSDGHYPCSFRNEILSLCKDLEDKSVGTVIGITLPADAAVSAERLENLVFVRLGAVLSQTWASVLEGNKGLHKEGRRRPVRAAFSGSARASRAVFGALAETNFWADCALDSRRENGKVRDGEAAIATRGACAPQIVQLMITP